MRSQLVTDINDTIEKHLLYDNPARYAELFVPDEPYGHEAMTLAGRPIEEVVEDINEVDAYFDSLEEKRGLTGGEVFEYLSDEEGWL